MPRILLPRLGVLRLPADSSAPVTRSTDPKPAAAAPTLPASAPLTGALPRTSKVDEAEPTGWGRIAALLRSGWAPAVQAVSIGASFFAPTLAQAAVDAPPTDALDTAEATLFAEERAAAVATWRTVPAYRDLDVDTQVEAAGVYARLSPEAQAAARETRPRALQTAFLEALASSKLDEVPAAQQETAVRGLARLDAPSLRAVADAPRLLPLAITGGAASLEAEPRATLFARAAALEPARLEVLTTVMSRWPAQNWSAGRVVSLIATPGFDALTTPEAVRWMRYVGGTNDEVSQAARWELDRVLATEAFKNGTPAEQAELLRKTIREQPDVAGGIRTMGARPIRTTVALSDGEPVTDAPLVGGAAAAMKYTLSADGRTLPLYVATGPTELNLPIPTAEQVRDAFSRMPRAARDTVQAVHVSAVRSPHDAHWAAVFGKPNFRAYMTASTTTGTLTIFPSVGTPSVNGIANSMTHEAGHFDGHIRWGHADSDPRWDPWKAAIASDALVPSSYARGTADEDHAEMFQLYMQVKGTPREAELRELFPARFALLDAKYSALVLEPALPEPPPAPPLTPAAAGVVDASAATPTAPLAPAGPAPTTPIVSIPDVGLVPDA